MNSIEAATEGRISKAPELRTSQAGKPWAKFSIAVGTDDPPQWLNVVCFHELAEYAAASLAVGDRVYVEGCIRLERWQTKDGAERSALSMAAWKLVPLARIGQRKRKDSRDSPRGSSDAAAENGRPAPSQAAAKRHWQRPVPTDARPASGAPSTGELIPF